MNTRKFKAGDTVKHHPTGETWLLIRDEHEGQVVPGGWPSSIAKAEDCTLIESIEDAPDRLKRLMARPSCTPECGETACAECPI